MQVETTQESGLNQIEFAKARKAMILGRLTEGQWDKANSYQKGVLHQIELAVQSITLEDLSELDEHDQ